MPTHSTVIDRITQLLESVSTLEGRLVLSALLLIMAVLVGHFLTPVLLRWGHTIAAERLVRGRVNRGMRLIEENTPWTVPAYVIVRGLQLLMGGLTILALLVVWGRFGVAVAIIQTAGQGVPVVTNLTLTLFLLVGAYVGLNILEDVIDDLTAETDKLDEHQGEIVYHVTQVVLGAVVILLALSVWNVNLQGVLVGAGFLGIVVGMAARQTLGSMLAGFLLMFSKPFEIGDWVLIGDAEGIVTDITIVNTRLENQNGEYIVLPNDVVSNSQITNRTKKGRLRLSVDVGVDYAVNPKHAEEVAKEAIVDLTEVMPVPRPRVLTKSLADSAIVLEVRAWIDKPTPRRRMRAKASLIHAIVDAFDEEAIKIPYPQRELSGRPEAGGVAIRDSRVDVEPGEAAGTAAARRATAPEEGAVGGDGSSGGNGLSGGDGEQAGSVEAAAERAEAEQIAADHEVPEEVVADAIAAAREEGAVDEPESTDAAED